ncbi:MAG: transcription termination/antitermination protein NusA, partial [Patescibacteria group bacterium]
KGGQNVRLAAKLTGWKINVVPDGGESEQFSSEQAESEEAAPASEEGAPASEETPTETPAPAA